MEKIDVEKTFPEAKLDFVPIPDDYDIDGWEVVNTKKGTAKALRLERRKDGLPLTLFTDQLRKEGDVFLVSKRHYYSQLARAEKWRAEHVPGTPPKA